MYHWRETISLHVVARRWATSFSIAWLISQPSTCIPAFVLKDIIGYPRGRCIPVVGVNTALGFQNFRPVWFLYPLLLIIIILGQKLAMVWKISGEAKFSPVTSHNILFWATEIFKMIATWAKMFTWIPARTRLADCLSNAERSHPSPDNNVQWLGNYI